MIVGLELIILTSLGLPEVFKHNIYVWFCGLFKSSFFLLENGGLKVYFYKNIFLVVSPPSIEDIRIWILSQKVVNKLTCSVVEIIPMWDHYHMAVYSINFTKHQNKLKKTYT